MPDLVVQQSFPDPRPTTNPYLIMLRDAIASQPGVDVRTFTWRRALLERYDVFHVHWPEILVSGHSPLKKLVRQALTLGLVLKLRITRTPIVRTAHNLELPTGISRRETALLRLIDRWTTLRIRLNPLTPVPAGSPVETIEHGDYRAWFSRYQRRAAIPGRLAYVGLVRRYKGVDALISAFRAAFRAPGTEPQATLTVSGKPSSDDLVQQLQAQASEDERVFLRFAFLTDEELVAAVTEAELIVLPYREMHNSGGALSSLSLNRPVLVPDNDVNRLLAQEVGEVWVQRYQPPLSSDDLERAIAAVRRREPESAPDLSRRGWDETGRRHVLAYRRAIELTGRRRGRKRRA